MLLNVIFSFNRALQLEYLLNSMLKQFRIENYKVAIVYHCTGEHVEGYQLLQKKFGQYEFISFHERTDGYALLSYLPLYSGEENKNFIKKYHFKNPKRDNFKALVERVLKDTDCEFTMFNTDDGFFYREFHLPTQVQNLIRLNADVSYRTYIGDNIKGMPEYVKKWGDNYLWDYYSESKVHHWSYPFAVDGTVYNTAGILKLIRRVAYHNPVTLESNAEIYTKRNKKLNIGLSPQKSLLICTKLNRVSADTLNPTIHISADLLNEKFLDGFELSLKFQETIDNANLVPLAVDLVKEEIVETIYEFDEAGREVQNNLTEVGAKKQMR